MLTSSSQLMKSAWSAGEKTAKVAAAAKAVAGQEILRRDESEESTTKEAPRTAYCLLRPFVPAAPKVARPNR